MTKLSQPPRTRILPLSSVNPQEVQRQQSKQRILANRCRPDNLQQSPLAHIPTLK